MCGICGFVTERPALDLGEPQLQRMMGMLAHRGPDGEGSLVSEGRPRALLGHRRLAVIDLDTGAQPMTSPCAAVSIVLNGEIYNYRDLRPALESRGHRFTTRSDTEVILHLYEEEGDACVKRLRGMFAFAIWDSQRRRLFAARDRLGVKPFVYLQDPDGTFAFASEAKALLTLPGVRREADPAALNFLLALQYVPHPWTGFKGIRKLPPAHTLSLEDGRLDIRPYWRLEPQPKLDLPPRELEEAIRERLADCVGIRLLSEVPLGAFLSGGLDSSAVVAAMAGPGKEKVRTFSIGFKEKGFDELAHARRVARHLETEHTEAVVAPDALAVLPRLAWHYDEPFADASAIPTFYVSREARRHVTVALTGDGGDECFGGYDRYRATLAFEAWKRLGPLGAGAAWVIRRLPGHDEKSLGRMARRFLEVGGDDPLRRYAFWVGFFDPARRAALMTEEALRAAATGGPEPFDWLAEQGRATGYEDLRDRMEALDLGTYLPCDLLTKVDLASMAVSLECRSPFLDHTMVEFAMRIPPEQKVTLRGGKLCLKRAMLPLLPRRNVDRAKMGFGVPVSRWLRRELSGYLRETLLSERALGRGLFRPEPLRALVEDHVAGRAFHGYRLWALLMLELWQRTWVDPAEVPENPASSSKSPAAS